MLPCHKDDVRDPFVVILYPPVSPQSEAGTRYYTPLPYLCNFHVDDRDIHCPYKIGAAIPPPS